MAVCLYEGRLDKFIVDEMPGDALAAGQIYSFRAT